MPALSVSSLVGIACFATLAQPFLDSLPTAGVRTPHVRPPPCQSAVCGAVGTWRSLRAGGMWEDRAKRCRRIGLPAMPVGACSTHWGRGAGMDRGGGASPEGAPQRWGRGPMAGDPPKGAGRPRLGPEGREGGRISRRPRALERNAVGCPFRRALESSRGRPEHPAGWEQPPGGAAAGCSGFAGSLPHGGR